ncbi:tyrosine-type recombinase/integrase [Nonomuraea angiospora]|uniref:tyrosine-type recombinase/integrase n=1 Tax=Nonomuraea angiospora TaxID=46172 RepID=UPI0037B0AE76
MPGRRHADRRAERGRPRRPGLDRCPPRRAGRRAHYNPGERALRILGKGNKEREVYLTEESAVYVGAWLARTAWRTGPLFLPIDRWGNVARRHLTTKAVADAVNTARDAAGLPRLTAHDFRRTFIGQLLDSGADLATAQALWATRTRRRPPATTAARPPPGGPPWRGCTSPAPRTCRSRDDFTQERPLDAAHAAGRVGGRLVMVTEDVLAAARARRERGQSVTRIARELGVGRSTLYRRSRATNQHYLRGSGRVTRVVVGLLGHPLQ